MIQNGKNCDSLLTNIINENAIINRPTNMYNWIFDTILSLNKITEPKLKPLEETIAISDNEKNLQEINPPFESETRYCNTRCDE